MESRTSDTARQPVPLCCLPLAAALAHRPRIFQRRRKRRLMIRGSAMTERPEPIINVRACRIRFRSYSMPA
jgi:hypothetical protein